MVNDTTSTLFDSPASGALDAEEERLENAKRQVNAQIEAGKVAAAQAAATAPVDDGKAYSLHNEPGMGQYVIPRRTGWQFLLDIIHDPVPNIDFSASLYSNFDGVIGQHFNNTRLLDPLDDHYESYESLRDNIAAVRNFLMARYFAVDSTIDRQQALKNMEEIAAFIGDGLYNNNYFGGLIHNHDPDQPYIDFSRAKEKGGHGAQYIYECILAHNRHSSGFRPFDAVVALFSKAPDWKLPNSDKTHFTEMLHHDLPTTEVTDTSLAGINAAMANAVANVSEINARLDAVRDAKALSNKASDLDNIGNHLIFTATHMDGVAQLDEPTRRHAVDIAKDILKKLKVTLGDLDITKGLNLKPSEDVAALGAIKGVAKVYERLVAWARSTGDARVLQSEPVQAATQAIAQMGYLAKQEALTMATLAGNAVMAATISEQLKLLPASYAPKPGTKFGELLDTVQSGMETILNRTQQVVVDGGQIGHALDGNAGGVSSIPAAGMGNQAAMQAATLAEEAQVQSINAQMAIQARRAASQGQQAAQPGPSRSSSGRHAPGTVKEAKKQAATVSTGRVSITAPLTAQQQAAARANTSAGLAARRTAMLGHHDEHEEHEAFIRQQDQQRLAAAKIKATALKLPPMKGFDTKTTGAFVTANRVPKPQDILNNRKPASGIATQTVQTHAVDGEHHDAHIETHVDHDHEHDLPPVPPTRGGRSL
jgi:hypothetical protein